MAQFNVYNGFQEHFQNLYIVLHQDLACVFVVMENLTSSSRDLISYIARDFHDSPLKCYLQTNLASH